MGKNTKQSVSWGDSAKNRFIKQHGSVEDIPEGDAHAVPVYDDPTFVPPSSAEETKTAMDSLEEKVKALKEPEKPKVVAKPVSPTKPKTDNFYDEWID